MDYVHMFLFFASFSLFFVGTSLCDYFRELAFSIRITNDEWREKNGYTRGLLGGWKRPKNRKK